MNNEFGTFEEYPELGVCVFTDQNGDTLEEKVGFVDGRSYLTLDALERVSKWAIKHGNDKGYGMLELAIKTRMEHNIKKNLEY